MALARRCAAPPRQVARTGWRHRRPTRVTAAEPARVTEAERARSSGGSAYETASTTRPDLRLRLWKRPAAPAGSDLAEVVTPAPRTLMIRWIERHCARTPLE